LTSDDHTSIVSESEFALMGSCQTTLKPLLRNFAALTLTVFVVAEALCFVHCHFRGGHGDAEQRSCHSTAATQSNHNDDGPSSSKSPAKGSCSTLQNLLVNNDALIVVVPEFPALYFLTPLAFALDTTEIEPASLRLRHARLREWALTPEVYLGPAIHSLAPPLLS
jgi:hypothetical protein